MLTYSLNLRDGSRWRFGALDETVPWLQKVAAIMRLRTPENVKNPNILFHQNGDFRPGPSRVRSRLNYLERRSTWYVDHPDAIAIWCREPVPDVTCRLLQRPSVAGLDLQTMMYFDLPVFIKSMSLDGVPLHGALVRHRDTGYILVGRSGTGKTTCCRRLPAGWEALADDEVLVVRGKDGRYYAHPFPTWSDYFLNRETQPTWDVEQSVAVGGLYFLQQNDMDEAAVLPGFRAVILTLNSVMEICHKFWHRADKLLQRRMRLKVFDNVSALCRDIPVFTLKTTLHGKFWQHIVSR